MKMSHLQGLEEPQVTPEEKGNLTLEEEEEDQTQENMMMTDMMTDMMTEVRVETEGGAMEQPESTTMGGQVDPEETAGRPNV